jgi:hypothetical protein
LCENAPHPKSFPVIPRPSPARAARPGAHEEAASIENNMTSVCHAFFSARPRQGWPTPGEPGASSTRRGAGSLICQHFLPAAPGSARAGGEVGQARSQPGLAAPGLAPQTVAARASGRTRGASPLGVALAGGMRWS